MRLTIKEAAERLGKSEQTIRRRLNDGSLRGEKEPMGQGFQWWVVIEDEGDDVSGGEPDQAAPSPTSPELLSFVLQELEDWKAQARRLEDANHELRVIIARQTDQLLAIEAPTRLPWWKRWFR